MDDELKALLVEQGEAIAAFKSIMDVKLDTERKEREALEAKLNRSGIAGGGVPLPGAAADIEMRSVLATYARTGAAPTDLKAMRVSDDPSGGYFVLPERGTSFITKLYSQSPMRRLSSVATLERGDSLELVIDREEATATWEGEQATRTPGATPNVGLQKIPLHEITALQPMTQKLLDTSYLDLGVWIEGKIVDKFSRAENAAYATGDGILKPRGFLSTDKATQGDSTRADGRLQYIVTGSSGAFPGSNPADKLIDLVFTLASGYRANAVWQFNSTTAGVIRKFKDVATGNYLWQPALAEGDRATLLGYPVEINEDMPDIGADSYSVAFGDFRRGYQIVDLGGVRMLRDNLTAKPWTHFFAYRRTGGDVADFDAIKLMKFGTS